MSESKISNQTFWNKFEPMLKNSENRKMFVKQGVFSFTFFDNFIFFLKWFSQHREKCQKYQKVFEIYELMSTGIDMCFAADIEVYVPINTAETKREKLEFLIMEEFTRIYGKYGQADKLVFMEDHRPSEYRLKKGEEKTPMYKISFHVLGKGELFNEMHTKCKMKQLASHVNIELTKTIKAMYVWEVVIPQNNVVDMGIYTRNRAVRTIYSQKGVDSPGFQLSERSKHLDFSECFITQDLSDIGKTYFDYDFPEVEGVVKVREYSKKHNIRVKSDDTERTASRIKTEIQLFEHFKESFGDKFDVQFNGTFRGMDSYELRRYRSDCPVCKESHFRNGAYITDIGGALFDYKCLANPENVIEFKIDTGKKTVVDTKYLESFEDITSKVISVSAPMGSGKTYQIEKFIQMNYPDANILFVTCRRGMARSLKGRLQFYHIYTDKINQQRQIHEYESLHKARRNFYNLVVIDEVRSMLSSAVCFETNKHNLTSNMETLQEICANATQVICCDADLFIDGAVQDFYNGTFKPSDIHHIIHDTGVTLLHHRFLQEMRFIEMMKEDLVAGKKIVLCCGSATKLKALALIAEKIVTKDKVGIYYADCPKQKEVENVKDYWDNYKFIGFTSTITVSIDYQKPVDRVYIYPDSSTCSPRDMSQMRARTRNINSNMVIVKYDPEKDGRLVPLDFDLQSAKNLEMNSIRTRRHIVTTYRNESEMALYGTIRKEGFGYNAKYYSSTLTDLWAWSRTENYIKREHWIQYFISILSQKGHTYSRKPEYCNSEEDFMKIRNELTAAEKAVRENKSKLIQNVSVEEMTSRDYNDMMGKKISGDASHEDIAKIEKYQVQRLYEAPVDIDFIKCFNKKKRAIFNRSFMDAFPDEKVRREIDLHRMEMKESVDDFRMDTKHALNLVNTLSCIGFGSLGDSRIRIDIHNLSTEKMDAIGKCVENIRLDDMGRKTEGTCPIKRFQYHLENILGYKFKRHLKQVGSKRHHLYSLQDSVEKRYLDNTIFSESWIDGHIRRVNYFAEKNGRKGEFKTICIDEHIAGRMNRLKRRADDMGISSLEKRTKHSVDFEQFSFQVPE